MALTLGKVNTANKSFVAGDHVIVSIDATGDNSYPTGGWSLTPTQLGLTELHHLDVSQDPTSGRLGAYDYAAQKLKTFTNGGTETPNATDLHTSVWRIFAVGKGFPTL